MYLRFPRSLLAACIGGLMAISPAMAVADGLFTARNLHRVAPSAEPGALFEVYSRPGAAGREYFCAAADYADSILGVHRSDRVVVVLGEAPSQTRPGFKSVHFSVRPYQDGPSPTRSVALDVDRVGQDSVIAASLRLCQRPRIFPLN